MLPRFFAAIALTLCMLATAAVFQLLVATVLPSVAVAFVDVRVFRTWAGLGLREAAAQSLFLTCVFFVWHPPRFELADTIRLLVSKLMIVMAILFCLWLAIRLPGEVVCYWLVLTMFQIVVGTATYRFLTPSRGPTEAKSGALSKVALLGICSVVVLCATLGLAYSFPTPRPNYSFALETDGKKSVTIDAFLPSGVDQKQIPAVVIFHGVEGATPLSRMAAHYPNAKAISNQGIATFFVRYFDASPYDDLLRMKAGKLDVEEIETIRLRDYEQWIDIACRSIQAIRKEPRVDPDRVAIIGYSLGCYVGTAATSRLCGEGYPCAMVGNFGAIWPEVDLDASFPPIQFYHGAEDEVIPIEHVRNAVSRLRVIGVESVALFVFPNQGHVPSGPGSYDIRQSTEQFLREEFASSLRKTQ